MMDMARRKLRAHEIKDLRRRNAAYGRVLEVVPEAEWPATPPSHRRPFAFWRSRDFLVIGYIESGHVRLSINRTDYDNAARRWREGISWDDLQRLKAEAGYGDRCAVEIYPPDAEIVNVANMRHLWILPESPAYMWRRGR